MLLSRATLLRLRSQTFVNRIPQRSLAEDDSPLRRGKILKGVSAAPGYFKGRACVLNDVFERGRLRRGDVLVVKNADSAWNEALHEVEALVVEMGGKVSHGPMIARRLGIPCVSELGAKIWDEIVEGDTLIVNGTAGTVEILTKGGVGKDNN